jgi:hypothetical protein
VIESPPWRYCNLSFEQPKFDQTQLLPCFSTPTTALAYCYNNARVIQWRWSNVIKNKFRGGVRSF